jgi:outer membrane immunogenic protein
MEHIELQVFSHLRSVRCCANATVPDFLAMYPEISREYVDPRVRQLYKFRTGMRLHASASQGVSMKHKGYLLATAAGAAAAVSGGAAQSADMAVKAPAPLVAAPSWAGWYLGLNAGANYQHSMNSNNFDPYGYSAGASASTAATGFIGGAQIGYNWQQGNFVYGLEGDISGLTGKASSVPSFGGKGFQNQIQWLSTFRARMGLAVGDTMVYGTGGLAVGGVKNSFGYINFASSGNKSESQTRVGWAVGGGVEHMLDRHWTVALEALFVDLGTSTVSAVGGKGTGKTAKFSNEAVIGRFKLNYKF